MTMSAPPSDTQMSRLHHPDLPHSLWQIANSLIPYIAISAILYAVPGLPWWIRPILWVLAAGFAVRIFIIQHDCGHGSFFRSRRANLIVGRIASLITMAPYGQWRRHHGLHHANWNNLDNRDSGIDIYSTCLTVDEYAALSRREQGRYRIMRNPLVSLILLPPIVFLVLYRVPFDSPASWRREKLGVYLTDLGILILMLTLGFAFGAGRVLSTQIPITVIAATVGVWLFSLQHRFEHTLWSREDSWSPDGAWGKGAGKTFNGGTGEGAKGNEGTSAAIKSTPGSVTYNEWSFAKNQGLSIAQVVTSAGPEPVTLSVDSVGKSIAGVKIKGGGNDLVLDTSSFYKPIEKGAYPIVLATYEVVCSKYPNADVAPAVKEFLTVALGKGQEGLTDNGYIPVPEAFKEKLTTAIGAIS